jgi:UDP-N-acetyl-D-glucosamine dehydrogenase
LDPHVDNDRLARFGYEVVVNGTDLSAWTLGLVRTDHDVVDYVRLVDGVDVVFDTGGVYRRPGITADDVVTL